MQPSDDKIQKVKDSLYSRGGPGIRDSGRPELTQEAFDVATDWQDTTVPDMSRSPKKKKRSILKYVLIFSVLFFLLSVGVITYSLLSNSLIVSAKNVDISIVGPVSIAAGTEASLDIVVTNNNATTLQDLNLIVEYPQGTRSAVDSTKDLTRESISLGDLAQGQSVRKTISAVLFGSKDSIETIKTSVEYRIAGSSVVFNKDKSVDISINSAPIVLTVTNPTEITTNQDLSFTITIASNATQVIDNLSVQAEYPFGFVFSSATPKPTPGTSIWRLGTMKPQEKRTITIVGKLQGQSNDERTFHFVTGPVDDPTATQVSAIYASVDQTVAIKESSIGVAMLLGGSQDDKVVSQAGKQTHASISWTNNLDTKIVNTTIEAKLSGQMFDRTKVSTGGKGFYRSLDETVVWDRTSVPELAEISPGDKGNVGFDVVAKAISAGVLSAITDPRITINVTIKGTRFTTGGVPEQVTSTVSRDILISSDLALTTRITHTTGPFTNTGTIPPRVDQPTTYTVTWALTNTLNDLQGVEVSALLPSYVTWTGIALADGDVTFDEANSRVVWKPNSVPKGAGFSMSPRTASFQISFTPSNSQVGNEVILLLGPQATAKDIFTTTTLSSSQSDLTTRITTDPTYQIGDEIVTP